MMCISANVEQMSAFTLKENWTKFTFTEQINRVLFYPTASKLFNLKEGHQDLDRFTVG